MPIFGAKSRAKRGCASKLSCGHRIDPAERTGFTEVSGEFAISQWADRVVGPYNAFKDSAENFELPQASWEKTGKTEGEFWSVQGGPGGNRNPPGLK